MPIFISAKILVLSGISLSVFMLPLTFLSTVKAQESPAETPCSRTFPADARAIALQASTADKFRSVHTFTRGEGILVAVIDTGVFPHQRLGPVRDGGDFLNIPEAGSALTDCDEHGTVVAGIIAARDTGDGVSGIAPAADILSIKQTTGVIDQASEEPDALAPGGTLSTLVEAINSAIDQHAHIINISVVSCIPPAAPGQELRVDTAPLDHALARAEAANIIVITAAGNVSPSCPQGALALPAHRDTVIGVGSHTTTDQLAEYSLHSPFPQVSARGDVSAALNNSGTALSSGIIGTNQEIAPFVGTSFAAPIVSGTAALLRQRYPDLPAAQIRERIFASTDPTTGAIDPLRVVSMMASSAPVPHRVEPALPIPADKGYIYRAAIGGGITIILVLITLLGGHLMRSGKNPVSRTS